MNKAGFFISILSVLLLASFIINGVVFYGLYKTQKIVVLQQENDRIMEFRNMFTEQVLLTNKEIDFETRLVLETTVRSLDDPEIFAKWQVFTNSETKQEATSSAKDLLRLLIEKTSE